MGSRMGLAACMLLLILTACSTVQTNKTPNIVLIIADDLAWEDSGAYGNPKVGTPNIDRLAREGLRFTHAFVTISSYSLSRSSIITGRYPYNTDAEQLHWPLPPEQVTFVEKLKAAGYWTAASGKWHLGEAVKDRFDVVDDPGQTAFQTDPKTGKMLAELERQGVADNTLILFISDNSRPFPGAKTTMYDTGIRTPLLARWPKRIKPGAVAGGLVSSIDLAPTILQLAGLTQKN